MFNCRICRNTLEENTGLIYSGMPPYSQHLPDEPDFSSVDLRIVQCPACGTVQLANKPVSYYREVIRAAAYSPEMGEFRKRQFAGWVEKYHLAGKKIFEAGCGKGEYLQLMQNSAPVDVYGIEYGEKSVESACKCGLKVEKIFFDLGNERLKNAPFDGFFILNYLEHIPEFSVFMRGIYNNLNPGAVGLVEVPNFDLMLKKEMFSEFTIDHLYYFTADSLKRALEINGFEVLDCRVIWHDYIISAEVRRRQMIDFSGFKKAEEELFTRLKRFFGDAPVSECAVWGAGHQAFALLAASGLHKKISAIIDSAPFKQNKFAPAGGVKIVPPDVLKKGDIRRIVIMAGSYSDEIAGKIRKTYPGKFNVAIVRENNLEIIQ